MEKVTNGNLEVIQLNESELRIGISELVKITTQDKAEALNRTNWIYHLALSKYRQASIEELERYENHSLSDIELLKEKHDSARLGRFLNASGYAKPAEEFEPHALISGNHPQARAARIILARLGIRIDMPINGVWLPNFKRNVPHKIMPNAPAHRTVHTGQYYRNVVILLQHNLTQSNPRKEVIKTLKKLNERVQQGQFPYKEGEIINARNW
ncbi:AHH domain-containing protein [Aliikangiella sp. IMCC44359]|uniref:AHH domain-containing protein n=1 Tax=Aliikangiella sp. IMCC44359 TaxID=3459125 RepID=UPI00403AE21E